MSRPFVTLRGALLGAAFLTLATLPAAAVAQVEIAGAGNAGASAGGRVALERFADGLETYHASFEQKVVDSDGEVQDASSGEMWLSRPALFRWEYGGDFPEVIVADGERVWLYDISLEQVTVKDQDGLANDSPLSLLTDLGKLDEQFEVRDLGLDDGLAYVELRSVTEDAEFDRVLLGIRDASLELMAMEDAFGLRTEIRIRDGERNPELSPSLFAFEPPEGVDIVGDIAVIERINDEGLE